jgi:hypothetical protein
VNFPSCSIDLACDRALFTNSIFSGIKYLNLAGFPIRKDTPEQGLQLLETVEGTAHDTCEAKPERINATRNTTGHSIISTRLSTAVSYYGRDYDSILNGLI